MINEKSNKNVYNDIQNNNNNNNNNYNNNNDYDYNNEIYNIFNLNNPSHISTLILPDRKSVV